MALLRSDLLAVYVATHVVSSALFTCTSANPSGGGVLSLLQPYDFVYYSGVRSYFNGEWARAAELLEKSIVTKEALTRVRRQCHDDCVDAGRDAMDKLGKLWYFKGVFVCVTSVINSCVGHNVSFIAIKMAKIRHVN